MNLLNNLFRVCTNIFTGIAYSRIKQKLNGLSPVQFRNKAA
ncbi:TPA: IS3 family transposase [Enterococcus faecalis]